MDVEIEIYNTVHDGFNTVLNKLKYDTWQRSYYIYRIGMVEPSAEVVVVRNVVGGLDSIRNIPGVKIKGASGRGNASILPKVDNPLDKALEFLDNVKETLKEKNKAYGDSAANPLRIFSKSDADEAIKVRIDDKLSRIAKGDGSGNEDAIKDLVGYLALLAGMRK